jgi:hypothetical protein
MSQQQLENGYMKIIISSPDKIRLTRKVHILVATAFIERENENQIYVNHKDGNKTNNLYDNLEWVTHQENMDHAVENNLVSFGENHHLASHTEEEIREICEVLEHENMTIKLASFITGSDSSIIRDIINRISWVRIRNEYNIPDKIISGYRTEKDDILEACKMLSNNINTKLISEKTGIDIKVILEIYKRERHQDISKDFTFPQEIARAKTVRITEELVVKICEDINLKIDNVDIAKKYNISKDTVSKIKNGRTWVEVTKKYL